MGITDIHFKPTPKRVNDTARQCRLYCVRPIDMGLINRRLQVLRQELRQVQVQVRREQEHQLQVLRGQVC